MSPAELRALLAGGTLRPPYTIVTRDGRAYSVSDPRDVWLPTACPDKVGIAIPGKGIALIYLDEIDAIHTEHEAAADGRK
jgi:hypothetical protein